jgi:hypothetical protein
VDVLKEEISKNRELQDNVKQLQGDVDRMQDAEAMKRAKDMYERARVCTLVQRCGMLHYLSFSTSSRRVFGKIHVYEQRPRTCVKQA